MSRYLDLLIESLAITFATLAALVGSPALGLLGLVLAAVGFGMLVRDKLA